MRRVTWVAASLVAVCAACSMSAGKQRAERASQTASPPVDAQKLLPRIATALEDYDLVNYYQLSRDFLAHHPQHPEAERIRYEYALQLVTENLTTPTSTAADEGRRQLATLEKTAKSKKRAFDAALLLMKFLPEAQGKKKADEMLKTYADVSSLDQVYFWLIHIETTAGNIERGAKLSRELLSKFPETSDKARYQKVIKRFEIRSKPLPVPKSVAGRLKGKVVIVDFWATWCAPCLEELPKLRAFRKEHCKKDCEILGVSLDEDQQDFDRFMKLEKVPWPMIRAGTGGLVEYSGVREIPTYFVLDRKGHVIETELSKDALYERVRALTLPAASSPPPSASSPEP